MSILVENGPGQEYECKHAAPLGAKTVFLGKMVILCL